MDLTKLIDAGTLAGWVRAGVAAGLVAAVNRWHPLGDILTPDAQTQLAAAAATLVVGLWSHVAKKVS